METSSTIRKPEYARFSQRLLAHVIDSLIIGLPVMLFTLITIVPALFDLEALKTAKPGMDAYLGYYQNAVYLSLATAAIMAAALASFASSNWQATPGKRIVGIYLTTSNGGKPNFPSLFGRFISLPLFVLMAQSFERYETYQKLEEFKTSGKTINSMQDMQLYLTGPVAEITSLIVLGIILFWYLHIFFTPEKTALHDMLFNTRVVIGKP